MTETDSLHRVSRDSGWQQSGIVPLTSLLMTFTGPKDPVVHLGVLTGMAKGPSVKAGLAIYSHVLSARVKF